MTTDSELSVVTDGPIKRMNEVLEGLGAVYLERTSILRALACAAIAGEHVAMIGKPGTAKTEMARAFLVAVFPEAPGFTYLLDAFAKPSNLFGPDDIAGLTQSPPRLVTNTRGKIAEATWAFLDEFPRANGATLNSLLTALNEREFDNGEERIKIPLKMVVGAANTAPTDENLSAFWDRFSVKIMVNRLVDDDNWTKVILGGREAKLVSLNVGDVEEMHEASKTVDATQVIGILKRIKVNLATDGGGEPSDRRWAQAIKVLRASALLDGREYVNTEDCSLLRYMLWDHPDQVSATFATVQKFAAPRLAELRQLVTDAMTKFDALNLAETQDFDDLQKGRDILAKAEEDAGRVAKAQPDIKRSNVYREAVSNLRKRRELYNSRLQAMTSQSSASIYGDDC